jgi:D-alanyl-D-alanine carboxypeptidase
MFNSLIKKMKKLLNRMVQNFDTTKQIKKKKKVKKKNPYKEPWNGII